MPLKTDFQTKNQRRKEYKDSSAKGVAALKLRREFDGKFGSPQVNQINYDLMVTGTSRSGEVRSGKEGKSQG